MRVAFPGERVAARPEGTLVLFILTLLIRHPRTAWG